MNIKRVVHMNQKKPLLDPLLHGHGNLHFMGGSTESIAVFP